MDWLIGKKTYIVAACTIIGTIGTYLNGAIPADQAVQLIVNAVLASTLRAGIARK
jgi:hypothetical protein